MDFQKALTIIKSAHNVLLTTHVRPDGDALGSLCGLTQLIDHLADLGSRLRGHYIETILG